ncbi:MAG TPA: PIG-L family deacetylase, partial [Patescibacteria group bacterium]|nr:PIG-L family deacetylase [Patescibacteria group bacterium]
MKTDILGVFAHPDDETGAAATLAAYARGRKAVVANVYCTRGEGGGNMVGTQSGPALGILREAELRSCLNELGVRYCYFLDRRDWAYTESLAATFEKWGREETLEPLVRLVRALRPEVMVTMNPAPTPGQHGHHQAAGVLATEAFTAAADPTRFPRQLHDEGLALWQPRKLYFAGKAGKVVCTIQVDQPAADGLTPAQVAARALSNHRSQAFGNLGDSPWFKRPQSFSLIKTFVSPDPNESDLLRGLPVSGGDLKQINVAPDPVPRPVELSFVARPAVNRYRLWVKEQHIEHAATQFTTDLPLVTGVRNEVQVVLKNNSGKVLEGGLRLTLPNAWITEPATQNMHVETGRTATTRFMVTPPASARGDEELAAQLSNSDEVGKAAAHLLPSGKVPRLTIAPRLDNTDTGWEKVPVLKITPKDLAEGHVSSESDSSANFRVAHDGQTLFVDVKVSDDVVVTNIAPNDIKGHWRSDSVEICVDPIGG